MSKKSFISATAVLVFGACNIIALEALVPNVARAESHYCQCVEYVKNRFGITQAVGNAKDMIYSLPNLGFRQVSRPEVGAVVIMQPSFPGADTTYGHVGFIDSYNSSSGKISVKGANQRGGGAFTESNCNNVTVIGFGTSVNGRSDISFWIKGNNPVPSTGIQSVNFPGKAAPTGVNIRSGPSLNASILGRLQPNQNVSFSGWTYGDVVNDYWAGTPDKRWYRLNYKVNGQDAWVSSATINGNAPNSRPMP